MLPIKVPVVSVSFQFTLIVNALSECYTEKYGKALNVATIDQHSPQKLCRITTEIGILERKWSGIFTSPFRFSAAQRDTADLAANAKSSPRDHVSVYGVVYVNPEQ